MKKYLLIFFVYYLLLTFFSPKIGFGPDQNDTARWAGMFLHSGIWNAYKEGVNYPPISLYVYYIFGALVSFLHLDLVKNVFLSKDINFVFDIGSFYIVLQILRQWKISTIKMFFIMGNLTLLYNSLFWGQFDSIYTFFGLFAVYLALIAQPLWGSISLIFAINAKPQALLFIPIFGLLILPFIRHNFRLFYTLAGIAIITQLVIFLPFILHGTEFDYTYVLLHTTSYFPVLSANAFNIWILVFGYNHESLSDSVKLFGFSARTLGLVLFLIVYCFSLLPLIFISIERMKSKVEKILMIKKNWQIVFLAISLAGLSFFFFNTQMHERYANPALIFAAVYALLSNKYLYYFGLSAAYLFNMMYVFNTFPFDLHLYITPFNIALLYLYVFLFGIGQLYSLFLLRGEKSEKNLVQYL